MEYGQSSGMVNVDGTMMPDPTKHPELEAMVRVATAGMAFLFACNCRDQRTPVQLCLWLAVRVF